MQIGCQASPAHSITEQKETDPEEEKNDADPEEQDADVSGSGSTTDTRLPKTVNCTIIFKESTGETDGPFSYKSQWEPSCGKLR